PYSPSVCAACVAPGPSATAATSSPRSRAFVSSSRATGCGFPSGETSEYTQTFVISDHLRFRQEVGDPLRALAVVLDDLSRGLLGRRIDGGDLLCRLHGLAVESQVAHAEV